MIVKSQNKILDAIDLFELQYLKEHLGKNLRNCTNYKFIEDIIREVLTKYKIIKDTQKFDNCKLINYIITQLTKHVQNNKLKIILQNLRIKDDSTDEQLSVMDYIYRNKLFFFDCDLVSIFWKKKVVFTCLNNYYLTYVFEHYNKILQKRKEKEYEKLVVYQIIKSCNIIELSSDSQSVIDNLIYMFKVIKKEEYKKYKTIYINFEEYDKFYNINRQTKNIKYFMINVLFFTMLEKINYKSLYKLMKTIIYNRELLSYLRSVLREDQDAAIKYKNINEIAKESIFISNENQMLLNNMIDVIFNFENTTATIMKNNKRQSSCADIIKIKKSL